MKNLLFSFSFLFLVMSGHSENDVDTKLGKIVESFITLKTENKLPGIEKSEQGELSTYFLSEDLRKTPSFKEITNAVAGCKEVYIAEVKVESRKLRYAFCLDDSVPKYLSAFSEKNGKWISLPKKAIKTN